MYRRVAVVNPQHATLRSTIYSQDSGEIENGRTLHPSQSFFTLLLTFIPLDCSTERLRIMSSTGLLQFVRIVLALPKSSHVECFLPETAQQFGEGCSVVVRKEGTRIAQ